MSSEIECLLFSLLLVCVLGFIFWSVTWFDKKDKEKEV